MTKQVFTDGITFFMAVCSIVTHAHSSYCPYNREMFFDGSTEQSMLYYPSSLPHPPSKVAEMAQRTRIIPLLQKEFNH
jgi:hypothetical protein